MVGESGLAGGFDFVGGTGLVGGFGLIGRSGLVGGPGRFGVNGDRRPKRLRYWQGICEPPK